MKDRRLGELPGSTVASAIADMERASSAALEAAGQRAYMDGIAREVRSTRALIAAAIWIQLAFFAPPWISLACGALAGERVMASLRARRS